MHLIIKHRGRDVARVSDQILTDDYDCQACGRHIFLCAAVNHAEFCNIQRLRKEAGRDIRHQRYVACLRQIMINCAIDRIIHADIEIIRIRREICFVELWDVRKGFIL